MPVPRHSVAVPSVQLAVEAECGGVTELRVHGVGGTPPDAILGDLAPEQVMGDAVAGFYRTSDHHSSDEDRDARRDVDRHVEVFSWGGLTSRSKIRVLWLALLPFLFANLAGWMCPPRTRQSAWRFRLHRLAAGLCALALTVNAALIAVMISADVVAYQTSRAGVTRHQWWLAPLGWHFVAGNPARQVTLGVLVVVLFVLALVWLASRSWRYEAVRPPYRKGHEPDEKARKAAADTLVKGLADQEFWDGEGTVRLLTWLHVAVAGGFLAIMLGVTVRALAAGSPQASALGWTGIALGSATIVLAVGYIGLDALDTPPWPRPTPSPRRRARRQAPRLGGIPADPGGRRADLLRLVRMAAAGHAVRPGGGPAWDGRRDRMDRAGDRGGGGHRADIHAARPAWQRGNADRRPLGHLDAGVRHAEHPLARRGNLGGAPGGAGDQRRGHGAVHQARPDLRLVRDHIRGASAGLGSGAGRRSVRGGRGGPLAADGQAARGHGRRSTRRRPRNSGPA